MFKKYKKAIAKWQKEVELINNKIEKDCEAAYDECAKSAAEENKKKATIDLKYNESPCSVCGKKEFVMKYREVTGKIKGETSGFFSLFGGSIHGYIDGSISTKPVLSCRNCENERLIRISSTTSIKNIISRQLPYFWYCREEADEEADEKASGWLQSKGLEVAKFLNDKMWDPNINFDNYDIERIRAVGLDYKYTFPPKPKWWHYIF